MNAMPSGTALVNYALKNDAQNISIAVQHMESTIAKSDPEVRDTLRVIQRSQPII